MPKRPALPPSPVDLVDEVGQPIGFGLAKYLRQLDKYGPDMLMETAAEDLSKNDLAVLRYRLSGKQSTHFFKDGKWHKNEDKKKPPKRFETSDNFYAPPKCVCGCGREIPPSRLMNKRGPKTKYFSDSCKVRVSRRKARERDG